jgi:hypothetical protein
MWWKPEGGWVCVEIKKFIDAKRYMFWTAMLNALLWCIGLFLLMLMAVDETRGFVGLLFLGCVVVTWQVRTALGYQIIVGWQGQQVLVSVNKSQILIEKGGKRPDVITRATDGQLTARYEPAREAQRQVTMLQAKRPFSATDAWKVATWQDAQSVYARYITPWGVQNVHIADVCGTAQADEISTAVRTAEGIHREILLYLEREKGPWE